MDSIENILHCWHNITPTLNATIVESLNRNFPIHKYDYNYRYVKNGTIYLTNSIFNVNCENPIYKHICSICKKDSVEYSEEHIQKKTMGDVILHVREISLLEGIGTSTAIKLKNSGYDTYNKIANMSETLLRVFYRKINHLKVINSAKYFALKPIAIKHKM